MSPKQLEHGTPEAYDAGCTDDRNCPALEVHGLTCATAHYRFVSGERRYMQARGQRLTPPQIARKLGLSSGASMSKLNKEEISRRRGFVDHTANPLKPRFPDTHDAAQPTTTTPKETPAMPAPNDIQQRSPQPKPPAAAKRTGHAPPPSPSAGMTSQERADIRAWARANGLPVSDKARIPGAVVNAYRAAHTGAPQREGEEAAGPDASPSPITPALADFGQDFGPRSDQLDETRARINEPVTGDQILAAIQGQPAIVSRDQLPAVEWAEVTVSVDVESARRIAISLEQELSKTEQERDQALAALELTLRKWHDERGIANTLAEVAEHQDRDIRFHDGSLRLHREMLEQAEGELRDSIRANAKLAHENADLRNQRAKPWWKRALPWT